MRTIDIFKLKTVQRLQLIDRYQRSVKRLTCPHCGATGLEVVDLYTEIPGFSEPDMPNETKTGAPLPRYLCGKCLEEWDVT